MASSVKTIEFIAVVLFVIFSRGYSLNCLTCNQCSGDVLSKECNSTQDICVTYKTNDTINLRCGLYEECIEGHKRIMFNAFKFIAKKIEFKDIFEDDSGTSIECCKFDNCNQLIETANSVNMKNESFEIDTNSSTQILNTEVDKAHGGKDNIYLDKINSSNYIAPKLLKLTVKRDALIGEGNRNADSIRGDYSGESNSILDDHLSSSDKIQDNSNNETRTDQNYLPNPSFTEIGSEETILTTDSSREASSAISISSSQYWNFVGVELLIFISLCNFSTLITCFI